MARVKPHVIRIQNAPKLGENDSLAIVYGPISSYTCAQILDTCPSVLHGRIRSYAISRVSCHHWSSSSLIKRAISGAVDFGLLVCSVVLTALWFHLYTYVLPMKSSLIRSNCFDKTANKRNTTPLLVWLTSQGSERAALGRIGTRDIHKCTV